jgi:hypothetical protein
MDSVNGHDISGQRTHIHCVITRPLDSGYVQLVVRSAVEFLQTGEHPDVQGITISAPFAEARSTRLFELALGDARAQGLDGQIALDGERCELRLTRVNDRWNGTNGSQKTGQMDLG